MKTAKPSAAIPAPSPPSGFLSRTNSPKVLLGHLEKLAIVYVRQSSPTQVLEHRESTARQYGFADQAVAFGWPRERVLIIDEDLGKSGRTAEGRSGFQRLITEVTLNHVGIVLGLEMSRLARSSKDWHAFFEMCAVFGTLIADADGVYDGNDPNDRLLLGLKGIMSEMELHIMRNRLERGRDNKAQRGELLFSVPVGYVILPTGEVAFDPDEQAQEVIRLIFDKFDELGTVYGTFHWLIRHDIKLPIRPLAGARKGQLDWRRPTMCTLTNVLGHRLAADATEGQFGQGGYGSVHADVAGTTRSAANVLEARAPFGLPVSRQNSWCPSLFGDGAEGLRAGGGPGRHQQERDASYATSFLCKGPPTENRRNLSRFLSPVSISGA